MKEFIRWAIYQAFRVSRMGKLAAVLGIYRPKVVGMLDGGLGSQMWQFCLGYAVAKQHRHLLWLDTSFYGNEGGLDKLGKNNRRFLLMETFPEIRRVYSRRIVGKRELFWYKLLFTDKYYKRQYVCSYSEQILKPGALWLGAYYENARYMLACRDELLELFRFDIPLKAEERVLAEGVMLCRESCFVHIRKGDYVNSIHDVCSDAYYLEAMKRMAELYPEVTFYIFSNDETYATKLCAGLPYSINLISGRHEEDPRVDLYLMTLHRHAIISNSQFSWFGAFLRRDRRGTVCMPYKWLIQEEYGHLVAKARQMEGWLMLPC